MRHLDLFSGIGGFALAARWAGIETVQFCEIDPFCQKVLAKNFPGVPIHDDIATLAGDTLGPVDLITGGFPCQPVSLAGQRRGKDDDRWLWPEMARLVDECRPRWVLGENVVGLVNMGLDECLADLEALGYEARAVVVPACAVGAPHRRDRVWIVAHAEDGGFRRGVTSRQPGQPAFGGETLPDSNEGGRGTRVVDVLPRRGESDPVGGGSTIADTNDQRQQQSQGRERESGGWLGDGGTGIAPDADRAGRAIVQGCGQDAEGAGIGAADDPGRGHAESRLGRTDDGLSSWLDGDWERGVPRVSTGIPNRVGRLKSLGNAIVPQVAYQFLREMAVA